MADRLSVPAPTAVENLLALEPLGDDRFAASPAEGDYRRTFGGLLAARVLAGAAATVEGPPCHALHLLFLRAGDPLAPMELAVQRLRDGRSFSARQVGAAQGERLLVTALASFHSGDRGPEHQIAMPDAPPPETIEDQREIRRRNAAGRGKPLRPNLVEEMLDIRARDLPVDRTSGIEGQRWLWFRTREALPRDPLVHQLAIAFASDIGLVHVGLAPHNELGDGGAIDAASLDHTIWFHQPARADDWLFYTQRNSVTMAGRGLSHGRIFDRDGRLVASVAQEILVRRPADPGHPADRAR